MNVAAGRGGFVVIYRWRLKPGFEADFIANWQRITDAARAEGSGGSSLFRAEDGSYVAIARWPSRAARKAFFDRFDARADAQGAAMQARAEAAVLERLPALEMDALIDDWALEEIV
ncbi:antibiotic biosynthesis monooxygenase family protein [Oleiagrimonas soli]|uniref:Heme-degrading monooxygenase HmoA n=1 Tax=Oleiagrimonas soli TaxID=1543381 RepID=A0A099CY48_9GAMM|nr:antibiotic biosynthesis monooxygenase [Oleiagrimonas soli]KGI78571.1 hypothetical protein LF63_0103705 [Oleiagrimonas soli]MBB6184145.1 heme-degrading monooxygenase HmoA [Oleiagrimonas soli]